MRYSKMRWQVPAHTGMGVEPLEYSLFTVEVGETLVGSTDDDTVDVLLATGTGGREIAPGESYGHRPTPDVDTESVWFLTTVDPQFGVDGYVLTNQNGLLVMADDRQRLEGADPDGSLRRDVDGLGTVEALLSHLRSIED